MAFFFLDSATKSLREVSTALTQYKLNPFSSSTGDHTKSPENELSPQELAIRTQTNFQRLLYKTQQQLKTSSNNADTSLSPKSKAKPSDYNRERPFIITIQQYYLSLCEEFEMLKDFQHNDNIPIHNSGIHFHLLPQFKSQLNEIQQWIAEQMMQQQQQQPSIEDDSKSSANDVPSNHTINNSNKTNSDTNNDTNNGIASSDLLKLLTEAEKQPKRRVMRFSERLQQQLLQKKTSQNKEKNAKSDSNPKSSSLEEEKRENMIKEISDMTDLLRENALEMRKNLQSDQSVVDSLDEKTDENLARVGSVNERMTKYVESTTGWTCTMCIMMIVVVVMFVWTFLVIYLL